MRGGWEMKEARGGKGDVGRGADAEIRIKASLRESKIAGGGFGG